MPDIRKTPARAAPLEQHGRDLQRVNEKLKDVVELLRTSRERVGEAGAQARPAVTPAPVPVEPDLEQRRLVTELALAREAAAAAEDERERLVERLAEIEAENQRVCDQYVAVQEHSTELAQRCAAVEAIHGALSRADTIAALQEIVINFVGSEELVVLERRGDVLVPVKAFGVDPGRLPEIRLGEGVIGGAAATGRPHVARREDPVAPGEEDLCAAIPLRAGDRVVGAIAIFRLLPHKHRLADADLALLDLLSSHGGLALHLRPAGAPAPR